MDHGNYQGVVDVARNGVDKIIRLNRDIERLQRALSFWLPSVPSSDGAVAERVASDAALLYGLAIPDEPCAEALGWITLWCG